MKSFYNITRGQLIIIWIIGGIGEIFTSTHTVGHVANYQHHPPIAIFFSCFIPLFLVFYTLGWRNHKKRELE
jgi:hypothetical protein